MRSDTLLRRCRYEVLPLKSLAGRVSALPAEVPVTVTCSPRKGLSATLGACRMLRSRGLGVIPHIAARQVEDRCHLEAICADLRDMGIADVFVPGGDVAVPVGSYESSLQLLRDLADLDHHLVRIGVAAYPEGHPLIDDHTLLRALEDKRELATYMVTQVCFSPQHTSTWLRRVRDLGVDLEVRVGVPGVVDRKKLLGISLKIGVGDSLRFLRKQKGALSKLVGLGTYRPDDLVAELEGALDWDPGVRGLHVYTFNQLEATEAWRREVLGSTGRHDAVRAGGDAP